MNSESESSNLELNIDRMSKKDIRKHIVELAWPSVTELVLVTLCDMINMMMVGQLGSYAITAVGLTAQPKFLMLSMFVAFNVGTTALVARLKGEGNRDGANIVVRQSLIVTLSSGFFVSILGIVLSRDLIIMMGGAPETVGPGTNYFKIVMAGFIFTTTSLCISAALRGAGNTKAAMRFNITANVINVSLNYVLINGKFGFPSFGVNGAAIATVTGAFASAAMAVITLLHKDNYISISVKDSFKPDFNVIKRIIKIGLPAAGEQFAMRGGLLIYTRIVAGLGTAVYAAHQISLNILGLSFMSGQAFGIAATSLVGQSLGKKDPGLARTYASETRRLGAIVAALIAVCFFLFGSHLVSLYTNEQYIINMGAEVLKIVALIQPFQSSFLIISGALRGAGDTKWPAIATFVGVLVIRPIFAFMFVTMFNWGLIGAWIALALDQLLRSIVAYFRFKTGKWTKIRV